MTFFYNWKLPTNMLITGLILIRDMLSMSYFLPQSSKVSLKATEIAKLSVVNGLQISCDIGKT